MATSHFWELSAGPLSRENSVGVSCGVMGVMASAHRFRPTVWGSALIGALKSFSNGYRAVDIRILQRTSGRGWVATIVRDCKVLGEAMDEDNGDPLWYRFAANEENLFHRK